MSKGTQFKWTDDLVGDLICYEFQRSSVDRKWWERKIEEFKRIRVKSIIKKKAKVVCVGTLNDILVGNKVVKKRKIKKATVVGLAIIDVLRGEKIINKREKI